MSQHPTLPDAAECARRCADLSPRERETLMLVAAGHSSKQAAKIMGLSFRTMETYRKAMIHRLSAANSVQAAVMAAKAGLL